MKHQLVAGISVCVGTVFLVCAITITVLMTPECDGRWQLIVDANDTVTDVWTRSCSKGGAQLQQGNDTYRLDERALVGIKNYQSYLSSNGLYEIARTCNEKPGKLANMSVAQVPNLALQVYCNNRDGTSNGPGGRGGVNNVYCKYYNISLLCSVFSKIGPYLETGEYDQYGFKKTPIHINGLRVRDQI